MRERTDAAQLPLIACDSIYEGPPDPLETAQWDGLQAAQEDDVSLEIFGADWGEEAPAPPPLRSHQARAWKALQGHWAAGKRRLIAVAPTGAGKSRLGREAADNATSPVCIVHTRPLARQNAFTICRTVTVQGIVAAARRGDADLQQLLAVIGPVDLLLLDEGHHYVSADPATPHEGIDWGIVHRLWPDARLLSLTATPERADGTPLRPYYDELVKVANYSELVDAGHLVPGRVEYDAQVAELEKGGRLQRWQRGDVVQAYLDRAAGLSAFIFCESCPHARETQEKLEAAGVTAACVDGSVGDAERERIFAAYERREVMVLTTVDVLTEGVDLPLTEAIILYRSIGHLGGYLQTVGRGLRPHPGKDECLVIDMSGCSKEFGFPHDDRDYSLDGKAISSAGGYVLLCEACFRGFGVRGSPPRNEETGEIDLTMLNAEDGTGPRYRSELASGAHVQTCRGIVAARVERIQTLPRLTAAERKTRSKSAAGSIARMSSYLGSLVWLCAPSKATKATPCPHCARERPRGAGRSTTVGMGMDRNPSLQITGPRTVRNAIEQLMRHLMTTRADLTSSAELFWQYFPEAKNKLPAEKLRAMIGRVWAECPDLNEYQRAWIRDKVDNRGWSKNVWFHKYKRFTK